MRRSRNCGESRTSRREILQVLGNLHEREARESLEGGKGSRGKHSGLGARSKSVSTALTTAASLPARAIHREGQGRKERKSSSFPLELQQEVVNLNRRRRLACCGRVLEQEPLLYRI
ncbi:hypothetical protein Mapa_006201 [Marchantia paleacea]|nr:hypothetical protein Mapa_006201 [Marchantia paleacea]